MKSLALVLSTILTLCQLSPTLQYEAGLLSTKNYKLEPLYLLQPNYLTTSIQFDDVVNYLTKNGFREKTTLGFVAKNSRDCNGNASLIPVYRFYNENVQQYILSTNQSPPNETTLEYAPDGIAFYASDTPDERCGLTVPLHSYWDQTHYVYTLDKRIADAVLLQTDDGVHKGIVCHIWLNDELPVTTTTVPTTTVPTTIRPTTSPTSIPTTTVSTTTVPTTTLPPGKCSVKKVTLRRLYKSNSDNHFYTTSESEANNATAHGYVRQKSPGKVVESSIDCNCKNNFIPIYRVHLADHTRQFESYIYTKSKEEADELVSKYYYNNEVIEYYCSSIYGECGATEPLIRIWRKNHKYDHYYSSNFEEYFRIYKENRSNSSSVPIYEGLLCYIWPIWRQ